MRAVLDTNVVISAFLWQKSLKPIYDAVRSGAVTPCMTEQMRAELARVLSYQKFKPQLDRANVRPEEIIRLVSSRAYAVAEPLPVDAVKDDPSDNHVLACAESAQADFVVSGDAHLLALGSYNGIPIVTPEAFISDVERAK